MYNTVSTFSFAPETCGVLATQIPGGASNYSQGTAPHLASFPTTKDTTTMTGGVIPKDVAVQNLTDRVAGLKRQRLQREEEGINDDTDLTAKPGNRSEEPHEMPGGLTVSSYQQQGRPIQVERVKPIERVDELLASTSQYVTDQSFQQVINAMVSSGALALASPDKLTQWKALVDRLKSRSNMVEFKRQQEQAGKGQQEATEDCEDAVRLLTSVGKSIDVQTQLATANSSREQRLTALKETHAILERVLENHARTTVRSSSSVPSSSPSTTTTSNSTPGTIASSPSTTTASTAAPGTIVFARRPTRTAPGSSATVSLFKALDVIFDI